MGASSSTSSSEGPAWYPGEPSADVLLGHENYYGGGDASTQQQPSLFTGGRDDSQFSITTAGKRAGGAAPTTTMTTTTTAASPTSTAATEPPVAESGGVGNSASSPSSANTATLDLKARAKRVERDINTLPVVELVGMKVSARGTIASLLWALRNLSCLKEETGTGVMSRLSTA